MNYTGGGKTEHLKKFKRKKRPSKILYAFHKHQHLWIGLTKEGARHEVFDHIGIYKFMRAIKREIRPGEIFKFRITEVK